jgi:hypothetical protein
MMKSNAMSSNNISCPKIKKTEFNDVCFRQGCKQSSMMCVLDKVVALYKHFEYGDAQPGPL